MSELLDALHRPAMNPSLDLASWIERYRQRPTRSPAFDAALGGREAGTIGLAFLAGYQAALHQLVPALPHSKLVALAATETGGGHPKAIETLVENGRISGHKRYITLGGQAEMLLVVARRSLSTRDLVVVELESKAPGVVLDALPPTPFVPDVPHAELRLDAAIEPSSLLAGDGYTEYLKPFRTLEDIHVMIALLAHAADRARESNAGRALRERLSAVFASLLELAKLPPLSPALHVALAGALVLSKELLVQLAAHLNEVGHSAAGEWSRDLAVLGVAANVREKRLERAWEAFG